MLDFVAETWTWFGFVMFAVVTRYVARILQYKSIKKLPVEDWCMVFVTMLYIAEAVLLIKTFVTPTNLLAPGETLDPATIPLRIYGSKLIVALEQVQCAAIWGCKACLLILYSTMVCGSIETMIVKIVACYAALGYTLMVILYLGVWCRPFYNYWSVPAADPQCSTALHHLIVNMVFNVSTDIMMLFIPLPLLIRTNLPIRKKIILLLVFSFGIFGITCAVLNKYYSFTNPYGVEWSFYYIREVSCAVIIANVPYSWALIRRAFNLRSFLDHSNCNAQGQRPPNNGQPLHSPLSFPHLSAVPSAQHLPPQSGFPLRSKSIFSKASSQEYCGAAFGSIGSAVSTGGRGGDITDATFDPDPVRYPELAWRKAQSRTAEELLDSEDLEKGECTQDLSLDSKRASPLGLGSIDDAISLDTGSSASPSSRCSHKAMK